MKRYNEGGRRRKKKRAGTDHTADTLKAKRRKCSSLARRSQRAAPATAPLKGADGQDGHVEGDEEEKGQKRRGRGIRAEPRGRGEPRGSRGQRGCAE